MTPRKSAGQRPLLACRRRMRSDMSPSPNKRVPATSVVSRSGFRVPSAAELVAQEIRSRIVRRQLKAGDALPPEQEMTKQFGVSRPVIRQALRILSSERLIEIRRGQFGGPIVQALDATAVARQFGLLLQYEGARLDEVLATRRLLEEPAARYAAMQQDPELVASLESNLKEHAALLQQDEVSSSALDRISNAFHRRLTNHAATAPLQLFDAMLDNVIEVASRSLIDAQESSNDRHTLNNRSHRSHQRILELIKQGDADAANDLWGRHLTEVNDYYLLTAPRSGLVVDLMTS